MSLEWFPKGVNVIANLTTEHRVGGFLFSLPFAAWPLNDLQVMRGSDPHITGRSFRGQAKRFYLFESVASPALSYLSSVLRTC